ncbi:MAG: xylulokinase [[Clostridium] scindens]|uniref:xylulokinase n=1 Tax=Clostridium scindens (strain JCM 10418 / VPI 12708) TaxID=29347 RepID=UPI002B20941C|nr:xylulokinase [[Clostridium] scindens]MEA4818738.1 xylulokinase [[Clostridium] scindens]
MRYILAHDLGTSGNKATLFSEDGRLIKSEVFSYDAHYFNDTWVEQNADDWWNAVCRTSSSLIQSTGVDPGEIGAISFSGQMMGCLCVDRNGTPLRPSIIWADQRAQKQVAQIEEHISQQDLYHIVGHRNTASYGIQKLMWVRDNEPEIYEQTYKTLNAKDYIVFKLTGKFYTEPSDANSVACFDLKTFQWSEEILKITGIDPDKLPQIKPSTFVAGGVTKEAARATGLAEGTPVVMGGGDGVVANIGCGSISPGKTYCCMGTSAWITTTAEKPIFDEQMRTVTWAHVIPGMYAPNGTMQYAGGAYNWLKNTVCSMESYKAKEEGTSPYTYMNEQIEKSTVGANGLIFLPYLLGERAPRWNPDAKGAWIGIKPETTRGDLLRSVLEGVTMNLSICLDILRTQMDIKEITVVGGGAKGAVWRQIMADIYNARIKVPSLLEEGSSMGAAVIGGVGTGIFKDFTAIDRFINIDSVHTPDSGAVEAYGPVKEAFESCYFALEDAFKKMARHL